jgi:hypothetical protein
VDELWADSRAGSHAGRGFHYQDAIATELAIRAWRGELALARMIPEGLEDVSLELDVHPLHLQAKSRRSHRGDFTDSDLADAWRRLAKRAAADRAAHVGLVLERPLGYTDTGLEKTLADVADKQLNRAVAAAVGKIMAPDDFLGRAHVLVMPAAPATAVELLTERLGAPPATCLAHYELLRGQLAQLADENGEPGRSAGNAAALTVADVARLFDDVSESVDPSLVDEALRSGAVELADFRTSIDEPRFYSGVDVVPGHIVAGLPLARDELVGELERGAATRGLALAVGPSGAGKSALIWLTAYVTRHRVRWYRVRRLGADDVAAVVRLVKALRPLGARVGFVVDDLGRDDRVGFDAFVDELRHYPDVAIIGACREEDLFLVGAAASAVQVRPTLDEGLAQRIWQELRDRGETTWSEWREPFAKSEGLLLEYGHLLTEGTRLAETIGAQVERRVREERDLELELLALVATADAYGAELRLERVRHAVTPDDAAIKRALVRLVDEHLISERDGVLGGLHELRSRHIVRAAHAVPPPTAAESVWRVIDLLEPELLQRFVTRVLVEDSVADEHVLDALAARLRRDADAGALAAALQALRLVGFRRTTTEWRRVFDEEGATPTNVELITYFAISGADCSIFPEVTQRTIARVRELEYVDLRPALLTRLDGVAERALAAAPNIAVAAPTLAALSGIGGALTIVVNALAALARDVPLAEVRLLLEAADAADPALAVALADALGGSAALLARLEAEQPWLRKTRLDVDDGGRPIAAAEYAYVAESHQPKAHDAVVELARYLAALAPSAAVAVCRAVDATGDTAGLGGVPLADKMIDRGNLPTRAAVAWNRARARTALAAVAAETATEHALNSREIVVRAARVVRHTGDAWARETLPSNALYQEAVALAEVANSLRPAPVAVEAAGPLDEGEAMLIDPASSLGSAIANQLFVRLFKGESVAPLIPTLFKQLDELATPAYWRLLDEPPLDDIAALRAGLLDIFAVAGERASGDRVSAVALKNARKGGLAAAAQVARKRAAARMQTRATTLVRRLADAGYSARVVGRDGEPESHRWPSDDFLILVDMRSIFAWQREGDGLIERCRPLLDDRVGFYMAPVRNGKIVASFALKVFDNAFPAEEVRDWPDLPLALVDETLYQECAAGLGALVEVSGVIASAQGSEVHDDEGAVVEAASKRAGQTLRYLEDLLVETGDPVVKEVGASFLELADTVEAEAAALAAGRPVERGVAASVVHGFKGDRDDVFATYVGVLSCCIEWDIDPADAWSRFQAAVAEAP